MSNRAVGRVVWMDLTVENAAEVRDFYQAVVGWSTTDVDMGDYVDFGMHPGPGGEMIAGICHARGENADVPPQWLMYVTVADVDASARLCEEHGGTVLVQPRPMGGGRVCVVRDPAGAVCALYTPE
jgi:uncharacterized protein